MFNLFGRSKNAAKTPIPFSGPVNGPIEPAYKATGSKSFDILHRRRKPSEIDYGKGHVFAWERRELPSAGANQYAFTSLGLPVYPWHGYGVPVTNPLRATSPGSYFKQTAVIVGNPPIGYFQGQFVTQPLMNPNQATALGIVEPGQLPPGAYNTIPTGAPVLAP